jgi:hypothetical protein
LYYVARERSLHIVENVLVHAQPRLDVNSTATTGIQEADYYANLTINILDDEIEGERFDELDAEVIQSTSVGDSNLSTYRLSQQPKRPCHAPPRVLNKQTKLL